MDKNKSMTLDLTEGKVAPLLIKFSIPFVIANALQTLYSTVDMVIVGQFVGSSGVSAISIAGQLVWLLTCLAIGYSSGGQVVIAQLIGVKDYDGVKKAIGTLFSTIAILAVIFTFLGIILSRPLLNLLSTPAEAMDQAMDYMIICSVGMIFTYGYNTVSAILRGMGDSKRPLYFIAIASAINVVLDVVFVGPLNMEAAGAAYATIIGQAVSFIVSLIYLIRKKESFGFDFKLKSFAIDLSMLKTLTKLGMPMAFQTMSINISMLFITRFVNTYGLVASAIYGAGNRLHGLMFIITGSMQTAGASMVGQNYSAGKLDRVKETFRVSMILTCGFAAFAIALVLIFPEACFSIFTSDPEVLAMAPQYAWVIAAFFVTFALMTPSLAVITGQGHASLNFAIAMADGVIVRILLSLFLANVAGMGLWGYFWGNALAGFVSVIWGNFYYLSGRWKKRKALV